jgi:hypothetical protein
MAVSYPVAIIAEGPGLGQIPRLSPLLGTHHIHLRPQLRQQLVVCSSLQTYFYAIVFNSNFILVAPFERLCSEDAFR